MNSRRPWRTVIGAAVVILLGSCSGGVLGSDNESSVQGVSDDTIEIGTTLPLSGSAAAAGEGIRAGLTAAADEINAAGGINGREISLRVLDDHFDSATHVANVNRLVYNDNVFALLVPAGTANLPGAWPIVEESGTPVFAPYLPDDPQMESVFSLGTGHREQAQMLTAYAADEGIETVGFIGQDNDFGLAMLDGLDAAAEKVGVDVVAEEWIQPNSTNVSSAVLNVKDANPDAVLLGTDGTQTALVLQQASQLDWQPQFMGSSSSAGTNSQAVTDAAGSAADGLWGSYFVTDPSEATASVEQFQASLEEHVDDGSRYATDSFALYSYAAAKVFFHILEQMGDDLSWDSFRTTAEGLDSYETGLLPPVTFGPLPDGHVGSTEAKIARFRNGSWTSLTSEWQEVPE